MKVIIGKKTKQKSTLLLVSTRYNIIAPHDLTALGREDTGQKKKRFVGEDGNKV